MPSVATSPILTKGGMYPLILVNISIQSSTKIGLVGAARFHAVGRTEIRLR